MQIVCDSQVQAFAYSFLFYDHNRLQLYATQDYPTKQKIT